MDNEAKTAALRRVTKDLEDFVDAYCRSPDEPPNDFVDEKCHDAALMLNEALQALDRRG